MRILYCIWKLGVGGTERQLLQMASGLSRRGIDLHVVTALAGDYDSLVSAKLHRVRPFFKYDPSTFLGIGTLARRLRPDLVHTFLTQMDIVAGLTATTLRIPWLLNERAAPDAYPPSLRHRIRVLAGSRADAIVANSAFGLDYWRRVAPKASRFCIIPNVIPVAEIEAAPTVDERIAGDVVLHAGRFDSQKNVFNLVEGLVPLLQAGGVTAVFCGEGALRPGVERMTRELGIAAQVRFLGNVANVWSWMKRASVVVSVSAFEGQPNAVMEAAVAGTPLVLSDIPEHRALFGEDAAWFVDGSSPRSITRGLTEALRDRAEANNRGVRARRSIALRSQDDIASQYERLYREIIG